MLVIAEANGFRQTCVINRNTMTRILIPTDFSDNAMHAAEYAVKLFGAQGNTFILLHTYLDLSLADPVMPSATLELTKISEEGLQEFADRLVHRTGAEHVKRGVVYGPLPGMLNEMAESTGAEVVVMGKHGKTGTSFFGSNTLSVIQRSKFPVLAVPESAPLKKVERILLADDYDDILPRHLGMLRHIATTNTTEVLVGHVEMAVADGALHWSNGIYELALQGIPHSFHEASGEDVIDGLDRLARHKHVDLIAVLHRHIGLMGRLFHPSTAKDLARYSDLPLLVLEQVD